MSGKILAHLRATRATEFAPAQAILDAAETEDRALTPEESDEVRTIAANVADIDARIAEMTDLETRNALAVAAAPKGGAVVRSAPLTYSKLSAYSDEKRVSYFKDLMTMATRGADYGAAEARLLRHAKEMEVEMPARFAQREANANREIRNQIGYDAPNPFEKRVNPNRTDGQGGYLVPPVWLMDSLIPILRQGRTVANQVRQMDLPEGTDSINIPKLSTGTAVAVQTADAASVTSTDLTDTSISAGVKTIAGQQDVAIQLLEQSPINIDEVVFTDIIADYNSKLDLQVIAGSNSSGQVKGLYSSAGASPWSGYKSVSFTSGSPTVPLLWSPLAQVLSQLAQARFDLTNVKFFMHPRRWFWILAALDSQNRPLVLPRSMGPFNVMGDAAGANAQGYVGDLVLGAPVFIDPNITTSDTAGSGSGQDIVIALKSDDAILFEGTPRQRTLPEILSGTLQVRFQVYNYLAFLLRYDQSLGIISGTGLAAPSGF